jgi:hypothetical protein
VARRGCCSAGFERCDAVEYPKAVRVWRRRDNDPENADLWDALAAEVAVAGGSDGPEL